MLIATPSTVPEKYGILIQNPGSVTLYLGGGGVPSWQGMVGGPGFPGAATPGSPDWFQQSMQGLTHPGTPQNFLPPLIGVVPGVPGMPGNGFAPPMPGYHGGPEMVPSSVSGVPVPVDRGTSYSGGGTTVHQDNRIVVVDQASGRVPRVAAEISNRAHDVVVVTFCFLSRMAANAGADSRGRPGARRAHFGRMDRRGEGPRNCGRRIRSAPPNRPNPARTRSEPSAVDIYCRRRPHPRRTPKRPDKTAQPSHRHHSRTE